RDDAGDDLRVVHAEHQPSAAQAAGHLVGEWVGIDLRERVSGVAVRDHHDLDPSTGGGLQVNAQDVGVTGPDLQHHPVGGGADQVVGAGDDLVAAFDVPDELIAGLLLFKPGQCLLGGGQLAGDPFPG